MAAFYDDYEDEFGEEFIQEEPQRTREKRHKRELFNFDMLLTAAGICLAVSSAFFPWYVFLNPDKFSIQEMAYGDDRILPGSWQGRPVLNVSPQAIPGRDIGEDNPPLPPDQITTASIPEAPIEPSIKKTDEGLNIDGTQTFPYKPKYKLLHVVNGRALIEDRSGTYVVKVGSVLPDNSLLAALEERQNGWVIVTSEGDIVEN